MCTPTFPMLTATCLDPTKTCYFSGSFTGSDRVSRPFHFKTSSGELELKPSQIAFLHPASDTAKWCDGSGFDLDIQAETSRGPFLNSIGICPLSADASSSSLKHYSCDTQRVVNGCEFGSNVADCYECTEARR